MKARPTLNSSIDQFLAMWTMWRSVVPPALRKEDAELLIRILQRGLSEDGISQSQLRSDLGINQPRLSKLIRKLVRLGWMSVSTCEDDGRMVLLTTTPEAKQRLMSFEKSLESLSGSKPQKKIVRKQSADQQYATTFDFSSAE